MNSRQIRKLSSIAGKLAAIADDLNHLIAELPEQEHKPPRKRAKTSGVEVSVSSFLDEIKDLGRQGASERLQGLKQKDVAQFYIDLGGASRDKKKPKEWLIERILWQVFDFQSGHDILRDKK